MSEHKKRGRLRLVLPALFLLTVILYLCRKPAGTTELIMEHTPLETSFTIMESGVPGNTILVVGGIHGDETSGWRAADKLKKVKPKTGTLIVLSPANAPGSRKGERNVELYRDLNRSFPGGKKQDLTDELAASIYQKIIEYSPDLVIDLHEASR